MLQIEEDLDLEEKKWIISECLKMGNKLKRLKMKWRVKKKNNLKIEQNNKLLGDKLVVLQGCQLNDDHWQVFGVKECRVVLGNGKKSEFETISQPKSKIVISKGKKYQCQHPECEQKFTTKWLWNQHMNLHAKKYQCQLCQKCFPTLTDLQTHYLQLHPDERPFACDWVGCDQRFNVINSLRVHIKYVHSEPEKLFDCQHSGCEKKFKKRKELRQHMNVHNKNNQCRFCQKCFALPYYLQKHLLIHSDERPFKCDWIGCGKQFKQKGGLKSHMTFRHTENRPFRCNENGCGMSFKTTFCLEKHLKSHKSDRPFKCNKIGCDKSFLEKCHLQAHLQRHSSLKPFQCQVQGCDKRYKIKSDLNRHVKYHQ